jgi:hypothetical protein
VFLAALVVGVAALVIVSLLTPPEPAGRIESFFERLQTCSDEGPDAGLVKPLLLVNLLHPRRVVAERGWRVFREDLVGFGVAWILVVVLVAATAAFLGM